MIKLGLFLFAAASLVAGVALALNISVEPVAWTVVGLWAVSMPLMAWGR